MHTLESGDLVLVGAEIGLVVRVDGASCLVEVAGVSRLVPAAELATVDEDIVVSGDRRLIGVSGDW